MRGLNIRGRKVLLIEERYQLACFSKRSRAAKYLAVVHEALACKQG